MLVLTRRIGEEIVIDGDIHIRILFSKGDRVRLGITAPESVRVDREEIHARRIEFQPARAFKNSDDRLGSETRQSVTSWPL
jgi:carbon storage regulator